MSISDHRLHYAATSRNREAIFRVLQRVLRSLNLEQLRILEIASGSGEHATFLAPKLAQSCPGLTWQPSDIDAKCIASIDAWRSSLPSDRQNCMLPAIPLDVREQPWPWPNAAYDMLININMIHISPWQCCQDLMREAGRIVSSQGMLFLYGPFMRNGKHTSASNAAFSEQLRQQDHRWGVRNLEDVVDLARQAQFECSEVVEMPANNLSVVFVHR